MNTYIAVDLGGTNIRAARYTPSGVLLARAKRPTHAPDSDETLLDRVVATITEVLPGEADQANGVVVKAISIGAPGPLNPHTGLVLRAPNLPGWVDFPLRQEIESHFHLPTEIGNDANLAAMAEWKFGAGRGYNDILYLTISTGIGGGVISGGRLITGVNGLATELGHVVVAPDGPVCGCGQRGHLEALAAGPAIALTARTRLRNGEVKTRLLDYVDGDVETVTAQHIGEAALSGDAFAISLLTEAGTYVGRAIADYLHVFNPSIVILGGGVASNVGNLLVEPAWKAVCERAMSDIYYKECNIVLAMLADDVGLLGALALAVETHPE
ncbi:MAG: ROK family protein [Chloroflexi bacterium]|nr:ROK family protein [Chloroflexota bacterium]